MSMYLYWTASLEHEKHCVQYSHSITQHGCKDSSSTSILGCWYRKKNQCNSWHHKILQNQRTFY